MAAYDAACDAAAYETRLVILLGGVPYRMITIVRDPGGSGTPTFSPRRRRMYQCPWNGGTTQDTAYGVGGTEGNTASVWRSGETRGEMQRDDLLAHADDVPLLCRKSAGEGGAVTNSCT